MATLYTQQSKNVSKTWLLMGVFLAFIVGLGYFASVYWDDVDILYFAIVLSLVMNISSYWFSDKIALAVSRAHPVTRQEMPDLYNIVDNLAITAGLPSPKLYVIEDPAPNAFATGRNKKHAAIAVTRGLLNMMNKTELEGVLAHEMSHIGNRDILLQSVIVVLVGIVAMLSNIMLRSTMFGGGPRQNDREGNNPIFLIVGIALLIFSPIVATLIQLAVSRKREFLADASGALLTRYPEGLASALEKIEGYHAPMLHPNNATAHMYISNPFGADADDDSPKAKKVSWLSKLFMTHPPIDERIKALLNK